jgi:hypothetical protein
VQTYTTLDGDVLDLSGLGEDEQSFFARCYVSYRNGQPWESFMKLVRGTANPTIRASGGVLTRTTWNHPLFRAVRDLEDRLGIAQGHIAAAPGDDVVGDPVADEWIPSVAAARLKGVSLPGLHGAVRRGDVVARRAEHGRPRMLVSANSLERWQPNVVRQAARRQDARGSGSTVAARA